MLVQHSWPGNVRELEHAIRRLVYTCPPGGLIDSALLADRVALDERRELCPIGSLDLQTHTDALERDLIRQALERSRGNRSGAAKLLGLSRNGLAQKMRRLEM
jgi:transcriptional regulator with PAS, ATPase and Fis domain